MDEISQKLVIITGTESKECEILFETKTAISNLLTIIDENKEISQQFFPKETDINKLVEKLYLVMDDYSRWWEKICEKYNLGEYNKNKLHLTFETNVITYLYN